MAGEAAAASHPTTSPFSSVADYVKALGGTRVVKRVLIANNGIGAVKAIRSIRRWAYETFGNEREVSDDPWPTHRSQTKR
jgi:hypothetical protein